MFYPTHFRRGKVKILNTSRIWPCRSLNKGCCRFPSARKSPEDASKPQLAFGHSRLAAFKFLTDTGTAGFQSIPLNLVEMTDEQMFQAAVAENRERKDLSPIEEAMAMKVYINQFHKTSEEVGQLFHLSDSAVRGKLRLLNLPEEIRACVGKTITEGGARELVTFLDLPEEILDKKNSWDNETPREDLFHTAQEGASAELIAEKVSRLITNHGKKMADKPWKNTDDLVGDGIIGQRKGCAFLQKRDNQDYCLKPACFEAKFIAWRRQYLQQASLLSGIPVLDDDQYGYSATTEFTYGKEAKLETIRAGRCENLRLKYYQSSHALDKNVKIEGFDHAEIVCCKKEQFCTCLNAIKNGIEVGDAQLAAEELKDLNRQVRAQKRIDAELIEELKNQTVIAITIALQDGDLDTWKQCLKNFSSYGLHLEEMNSLNEIYSKIAEKQFDYISSDKRSALVTFNNFLNKCGLQELDIVLDPPEEKKLIEVFGQDQAAEEINVNL